VLTTSFTGQQVEPGLGVTLHDRGIPTEVVLTDVNQIFQVCLQPDIHGVRPGDDIVILWRIEDLFENDLHEWANNAVGAHGEAGASRLFDSIDSLASAVLGLAGRHSATIVVGDAPTPVGFGLDHDDPVELSSLVALQAGVNARLDAALAGQKNIERLRLSALQHRHGTDATFDRRGWMMYRQPYPAWFSHTIGLEIAEVLASLTRPAPKLLVLDCDGTLWSGIAVDDGIGALSAADTFPGRAYQEFQRAIQRLRHRGVLIALSSKNDPETVAEAFRTVEGMVLSDDDIADRRISWNPKPGEIADLVAGLQLGLDAAVFVDDSPFEIGAVTTQLPDVVCLQVPVDIEELPDLLAESGLFRRMRATDDDLQRTRRMQAETQRAAAQPTTMSNDEFLASLELRVEGHLVDGQRLERTTQLINKTNQFNLTTRRRTIAEVTSCVDNPDVAVLAYAAADRFGDYGIIGVVIATWDGHMWLLDTVAMSCRVLGRGVETAILAMTTEMLRRQHPGVVIGEYLPTDRNQRVADLYERHGFTSVDGEDGRLFELAADRAVEVPTHITPIPPTRGESTA
jgi:FkbH-like protein